MIGTKIFYFVLGLSLAGSLSYVYALTALEFDSIVEEQLTLKEYTGDYQPNLKDSDLQIHTYEAPCKGFVVIEETDIATNYRGYGDLADLYTYSIEKPKVELVASSTPDIKNEIPVNIDLVPATTTR